MKISEIKKELKKIREEKEPLQQKLAELDVKKNELISIWQKKCRHIKTEEYCHYSSGGYDYDESSDYKRKCLSCGLVEEGKQIDNSNWFGDKYNWEYQTLKKRPSHENRIYGKDGRKYYFNPPKNSSMEKCLGD